jgi:hypothetical protein
MVATTFFSIASALQLGSRWSQTQIAKYLPESGSYFKDVHYFVHAASTSHEKLELLKGIVVLSLHPPAQPLTTTWQIILQLNPSGNRPSSTTPPKSTTQTTPTAQQKEMAALLPHFTTYTNPNMYCS